jgi:hypothetical protein
MYVTPFALISNLNQYANLDFVSDRMKVFANILCSCAEHTGPLSTVSALVIVSLMRLETIEELPQIPHERPVTQSTNHFSLARSPSRFSYLSPLH